MRKAKVVAIVCGMIASCLFGGFAVVEAATITLDDSSADMVVYVEPATEDTTFAATVTSIETTTAAVTFTTTAKDAETTTTAKDRKGTESETTTTTVAKAAKEESAASTKAPSVTAIAIGKSALTPSAMAPETAKVSTTATTKATTKTTTTTTTTTTVATTTKAAAAELSAPPMPTDAAVNLEIPAAEEVTEAQTEAQTEAVTEAAPTYGSAISVSESDYILLCNAVAHEAGSNNISAVEKAKVVEVIMNRVASPNYPNTIYGVLTQKYQFSGSSTYVNLGKFSGKVTDLVKEAVDLYLSDPSQFSEGYLSFTGDGTRNYFR